MTKYRRFGSARYNTAGNIDLLLDIRSWPTMQLVRSFLAKWLPDLPTWTSEDHYCDQSYFRNTFRFDGEYNLYLPPEAKDNVESLLLKPIAKCR